MNPAPCPYSETTERGLMVCTLQEGHRDDEETRRHVLWLARDERCTWDECGSPSGTLLTCPERDCVWAEKRALTCGNGTPVRGSVGHENEAVRACVNTPDPASPSTPGADDDQR